MFVKGKNNKSPDSIALLYVSDRLFIMPAGVDLNIDIPKPEPELDYVAVV